MNPPAASSVPAVHSPAGAPVGPKDADAVTGLPGLPTWHRVYLLVLASFLAWVGLLAALTWYYA